MERKNVEKKDEDEDEDENSNSTLLRSRQLKSEDEGSHFACRGPIFPPVLGATRIRFSPSFEARKILN